MEESLVNHRIMKYHFLLNLVLYLFDDTINSIISVIYTEEFLALYQTSMTEVFENSYQLLAVNYFR